MRKSKSLTYDTYFILKKNLDRLNKFKRHIFRQTTCIMVCFDAMFTFQNIRPDCSLCEEINAIQFSCLFCKHFDKFISDDHSLLLRLGYSGQFIKETICRIYINKICLQLIAKYFDHLFRFSFTKQTMIYMYTYKLITYSFNQHRSYYGRIYTA